MVAQAATPDRTQSPRRAPALVSLGQAVLASTTVAWLLVAGWLCGRRLTGEVEQPLGTLPLLAVGLLAAALISALRWGWRRAGVWPTRVWALATVWWLIPSLAALMLVVSVSVRGASATGLAACGVILLVHEALWGRSVWRAHVLRNSATAPDEAPEAPAVPTVANVPPGGPSRTPDGCGDPAWSLPAEVCQQITRSQSPPHGDTMSGVLRASFQPGERSRNLHVAFCPPMPGRPSVEVVQLSGPCMRLKAADVQPFGVRFDLRLAAASAQAVDVLIHFDARCDSIVTPTAVVGRSPDHPTDPTSRLSQ